jgi:Leucine-rich repeat (LRR) protein
MYTPQHLQNVEKINLFRRIDMKSIDLKYDMLTDDLFKNTKFTEISLINKTGGHIDLPGNLFYACSPFITALDLSNSSITHIPSGLFDGMIKLTVLRLNGNKIKTFPDNLFDSCSSLVSVFLHNNPFESVPRNLFSKTNNLREVSVDYVNIIVYTMLPNIKKIES